VLGTGEVAGVGRHALDVARVGIPGWTVLFVVPPGPLGARLQDLGAQSVRAKTEGFSKELGTWSSLRTLRRIIRRHRPAVLHSHLSWADVICAGAAVGSGARVVSTEHGIADVPGLYNPNPAVGAAKRALHRLRLRRTAGLLCVSDATRRSVETQWGPLHVPVVAVVRNGMDPVGPPPLPGGPVYGVMSRLAPEKRVDLTIRAFARVYHSAPAARLVIAGSGPLEKELRALVQVLALEEVVTFTGFVEPTDFLRLVDVVVQLSWWENCSYTLLDAVAGGRGVVATDVGGNRDLLDPGTLVSADPSEGEIVTAMRQQVGRRHALPDGWPDVAQMTSEIAAAYERVLGLGSGRARPMRRYPAPLGESGA